MKPLQVVCSVGVVSYGWDEPIVSCAILARPTMSLALYLQQVGRVLRPWPAPTHHPPGPRPYQIQLMDDLRTAQVDFLTIGQYLQPTKKHHPVMAFVTPEEFKAYETVAYTKGFLLVAASPLTRSSHHAGDDFAKLRAARLAQG